MRKGKILIGALVLFAMGFLNSCDLIEECGTCIMMTERADGTTEEGTPLPLCGDDLADREDQLPVEINGVTTYYECY